MDSFGVELEKLLGFCKKIAKYNVLTMSHEGVPQKSLIVKQTTNFATNIMRDYKNNKDRVFKMFKDLFYQICNMLVTEPELSNLESFKKSKTELTIGTSGHSLLRLSILYNKCHEICNKVTAKIDNGEMTDDRQELNYPMVMVYYIIRVVRVLTKSFNKVETKTEWLITDSDSIALIDDVTTDAEIYLGITESDGKNNFEEADLQQVMKDTMDNAMHQFKEAGTKANATKGGGGKIKKPTSSDFSKEIDPNEMSTAFNNMMDAGVVQKIANSMFGSLQTGDFSGMIQSITSMATDPELMSLAMQGKPNITEVTTSCTDEAEAEASCADTDGIVAVTNTSCTDTDCIDEVHSNVSSDQK